MKSRTSCDLGRSGGRMSRVRLLTTGFERPQHDPALVEARDRIVGQQARSDPLGHHRIDGGSIEGLDDDSRHRDPGLTEDRLEAPAHPILWHIGDEIASGEVMRRMTRADQGMAGWQGAELARLDENLVLDTVRSISSAANPRS